MLNNLTNFANIIRERMVKKTLVPTDLIAVGRADENYDGGYRPIAISAQDLTTSLKSDRLVAGDREVVLTENGSTAELTFDAGTAVIQTSSSGADLYIRTLTGDDIILESGDDITLRGDVGAYDAEAEGGDINIYGGDGSNGDAANAGSGGDIRLQAGNAGSSISGTQGEGGVINISAGYTSASGLAGGDVNINAGYSADGITGDVNISGAFQWVFNTYKANIQFPAVTLATLPNAASVPGARAVIADSNVPAPGNFGATAATGGSAIVPVFSDGVNWLIG
jgi:hypothetical protein